MKKIFKYSLNYLLIFVTSVCYSQNIDSLLAVLKNEKQDTTKLTILFQIVEGIDDNAIWPKYNKQAHELAEKLLESNNEIILKRAKKALAEALNNEGIVYSYNGEMNKALDCYLASLKIREEIGDKQGIANSLNNIGGIYDQQGNIPKSLEYYHRSLKIYEALNNIEGQATTLNNIGTNYSRINDFKNGLIFYEKSKILHEKIGNKKGIARSFLNIGGNYQSMGDLKKALDYYNKSLKIQEEIGYKQGAATSLNNIGDVFNILNDFNKALEYSLKSLQLRQEIGDIKGVAISFNNTSVLYYSIASLETNQLLKQKNLKLAMAYNDSSFAISKQSNFTENIRQAEITFSLIDSVNGNYKGAFEHYREYIQYRDKINNEESNKSAIKSQLNYEFEKKEAILNEQQLKERAIAAEKNYIQKIIIASFLLGFLLVVIFAFFIFRTLKLTKHQKHIIEEKQKEILDSIHYAKRIQTSLLPTEKYIERKLKKITK